MMMAGAQAPPKPLENTYLQEFPLVETIESSNAFSLEVRQGGSVRTHAFRPSVDYQGLAATGDTLSGPVVFVGYGIGEKGRRFRRIQGDRRRGQGGHADRRRARFPAQGDQGQVRDAVLRARAPAREAGPAPARVDQILDLQKRGAAAVLIGPRRRAGSGPLSLAHAP